MKKCLIACNFTNELIELIKQNEVYIDYIRWPSFEPQYISIDKVAQYGKPILMHGFNNLLENYISNDISKEEKEAEIENSKKIIELRKKYNFPYYSAHIGGMIAKIKKIKWKEISCSKEEEKILVKQTISNINRLKQMLDKELVMENIPIFKIDEELKIFPECVGKAEFISEIIYKTDTDFLLDIAHARVAASTLNMDIYEYLNKLPLERIREVHISGVTTTKSGEVIDFHNQIEEKDVELLKYVMKYSKKIQFITHEFTPQEKDLHLLKSNEKYNDKKYPIVKVNGINLEAKELLKKDLNILRKITLKYNYENGM